MENQSVLQKPRVIAKAVNLFWLSIVLGIPSSIIECKRMVDLAGGIMIAFASFIWIFTFAVLAFLMRKISSGRNWARITYLIFWLAGVLPALQFTATAFSRSLILGSISVLQGGLQVYSLFLLFTKSGSSWFRKESVKALVSN